MTQNLGPIRVAAPRRRAGVRAHTSRLAAFAIAGVLGILLAPPATGAVTDAEAEPAWVRVAHLVPDLPTMDIWLTSFDGAAQEQPQLTTSADYGKVSEYEPLTPGLYAVSVRPSDAGEDEPPILTETFRAEPGQAFTVAGLGDAADASVQVLTDDLSLPGDGQARVRLLPAASSAPSVTVTADGGPTLVQDAAYGTPSGYAAVPAGSWQLDVTPGPGASVAAAATRVDLESNAVYTLLVLESADGLEVKAVTDAQGTTVTPVGGAQTGAGGLADTAGRTPMALAAGALLSLVVGGALLVTHRRRQPAGNR